MNRPKALVFFSVGAAVDFAFGYFKWHSIGSGLVAIICGLPLTGFLFLCFGAFDSGRDDPGVPRS